MNRRSTRSLLILAAAAMLLVPLTFNDRRAIAAPPPAANSGDDKDAVAAQIKELQKQVAALQSQMGDLKTPRIIAAGTATLRLGPQQANKTSVRVKLRAEVAAQLGTNCIVELTNRYPTGDTFFVPYWKPAVDGFDVFVADPALDGIGLIPYAQQKEPYYIDWIVVQK